MLSCSSCSLTGTEKIVITFVIVLINTFFFVTVRPCQCTRVPDFQAVVDAYCESPMRSRLGT